MGKLKRLEKSVRAATQSETYKGLEGSLVKGQLREAAPWDPASKELMSWDTIREMEVQLP